MNGLDRIREAAARDRSLRFTNLMHHITEGILREAYYVRLQRLHNVWVWFIMNQIKTG